MSVNPSARSGGIIRIYFLLSLILRLERRRGRVVRAAIAQKVAVSREFEARLRHAATGKLSLLTQEKMGKAAKGEGWAPPFISCAQDTVKL